mmetsp:Transcript_20694/g.44093  ORF Transcript_20694/g.44093 Transcript_20694/m.44093 type:complete len:291 (-) Transcript_20694:84-956(-)
MLAKSCFRVLAAALAADLVRTSDAFTLASGSGGAVSRPGRGVKLEAVAGGARPLDASNLLGGDAPGTMAGAAAGAAALLAVYAARRRPMLWRSVRGRPCTVLAAQDLGRREVGAGAASVAWLLAGQGFTESAWAESFPIMGDEKELMSQKGHGTTARPVQEKLRWEVDRGTADRICSYNRHYAEYAGYWRTTSFLKEVKKDGETTFYDSVTGKPLFIAPRGRSFESFKKESTYHGWPSFRDEEVVWENVRCLGDGECVSVDGTHLGHNIPDGQNRYCINIVSVSGQPSTA